MRDSTCVLQACERSSLQQGDTAVRALKESVSFGRFVTETLEWDKWSIFSQNRYLEEAKRFSKPGLVAQKKAHFEAHFKKIAADKAAAAAALRELDASNLSTNCKPGVYLESVKFDRADADRNSAEADGDDKIASAAEVFVSVNNSDDAANFVQMDAPDVIKTKLDRSEVVNNSTMVMDDLQNKIAVREPVDQFVVASPGKYKPNVTCSKTLVSVTKPGVQSNMIPRPPALPLKENNTTRNTKTFGSAMLNKKKETTKSLHMSTNLKSSHLDFKRLLAPKKFDSAKSSAASVSLRSSKEYSGPSQVSATIGNQRKQATASSSLSAIRKSSAELYTRPAPSQLKKDKIVMPKNSASMRNTSDMRKSKPKSLHMSINLDSHIAKKERLVFLPKTGTNIDATSIRTSMSDSAHASADKVILDSTMRRKKIIPIPNSSTDVRKLIQQFHAKPAPLLSKSKNSGIRSNTGLTSSHVDKMKSMPKSLHMSVDLSSTVGVLNKPTPSQKRVSYRINAPTVRSSMDCAIQGSRTKSIQSASGMKDTEKCPPQKVVRPETPTNLIRPPSPTVSTPFRFRSDERAAKHKEFPSPRFQSPYARKPTPNKARETNNCKPPQTPTIRISTTSITLLPRKPTCENASNKIEV